MFVRYLTAICVTSNGMSRTISGWITHLSESSEFQPPRTSDLIPFPTSIDVFSPGAIVFLKYLPRRSLIY